MSYFPGNVKRIPSELVGVWRKVVLDRGLHIRLGIRLKGTVPVKNKELRQNFTICLLLVEFLRKIRLFCLIDNILKFGYYRDWNLGLIRVMPCTLPTDKVSKR